MPNAPLVSLIIPTHNRPAPLHTCLTAVAAFDRADLPFEVIVVDDGSRAPVTATVAPFRSSLDLQLIRQANAGPAAARNRGAAAARGKFLAFTDDDCAPAPDWPAKLVGRLETDAHLLVGGQTVNGLPDNLYASAAQLLITYLYTCELARPTGPHFFTSNNMALSAACFHAIGGFDTTYPRAAGEDREFCDRWCAQGKRLAYVPDALVYHSHALDGRRFCRQNFHYGRGAYQVRHMRAQQAATAVQLEALNFYLDLLRFPLQVEQGGRAWQLAALLLLAQVANATGFFVEMSRHER